MFDKIRIVLIATSHPGNIGAAARAMKNMCLSRLYLVEPKCFPHADASSRASGASDVLDQAIVCSSLDEALQDCSLVVGASARSRSLEWPLLNARDSAEKLYQHARQGEDVAILFGRERSGLTNLELDKCQIHVHIDANEQYSSLNIAAAVQVLTYEIHQACLAQQSPIEEAGGRGGVSHQVMEDFYAHLDQLLQDIDFIDERGSEKLFRRLRRLFNRAELGNDEVNMLRGIFSAAQGRKSMRRQEGRIEK
ncbi:MAG: RNA methyltransferase [gamma proteobacterium symbiont of Bathyaustriella thionipta]|nr:RNA methyltransferase [gamma proteobacterium symbiont of Bathyaustriella thionipta]